MKANEKKKHAEHTTVDVEQLFDDPELQKLHEERLARLKADQEKRQARNAQPPPPPLFFGFQEGRRCTRSAARRGFAQPLAGGG